MFKSIINLCKSLDNKKLFKESDLLFNFLKTASTEDEGKTIEQLEQELKDSVTRLNKGGRYLHIPITVKEAKYTADDLPKLQDLRQQIIELIDEFRAAMKSDNEDFYADVQNYKRYSDLKKLETEMHGDIFTAISKRRTMPIIEPRTDAEFDSYNRMNQESGNYYREWEKFNNICQNFQRELSYKTALIYNLDEIRTAQSGYVIAFDPKLIELGLKQGTITHNGKMEGGEFFFLVDTNKGQRVYPLPSGAQFVINAEGYYDLPFKVIKREDGTLKFQRF